MKKLMIIALGLTLTLTSCSSSNDREETPTEVQDFTNANYIKGLMVGKWLRTHSFLNGYWREDYDLPNTPHYESYYTFSTDNKYYYKPYTNVDFSDFNESGTYTIAPATSTVNAQLILTYSQNNKVYTRKINLVSFENGIVEISENSIVCSGGLCREKYKKQ